MLIKTSFEIHTYGMNLETKHILYLEAVYNNITFGPILLK